MATTETTARDPRSVHEMLIFYAEWSETRARLAAAFSPLTQMAFVQLQPQMTPAGKQLERQLAQDVRLQRIYIGEHYGLECDEMRTSDLG